MVSWTKQNQIHRWFMSRDLQRPCVAIHSLETVMLSSFEIGSTLALYILDSSLSMPIPSCGKIVFQPPKLKLPNFIPNGELLWKNHTTVSVT